MPKVPRLHQSIKPSRYVLDIRPDFTNFTFELDEEIEFELVKTTAKLTFHAVGLKIIEATLDSQLATATVDDQAQTVTFATDQPLAIGRHRLFLKVEGQIAENMHGFYRSRYFIGGQDKWLLTTQFESVHAREAFVAIDEPAAKAVFDITITAPIGLTIVSNTDIKSQEEVGSHQRVSFNPTPTMSTYLVAYIIGELDYRETRSTDGITVRVYATPDKVQQTAFAAETGAKILSYYNQYFGIPYPLPKLDMLAIPDFAAGAMENWGAVTYRETALLIDPSNSSISNYQRVVTVIAHELAHQWFGNLVTMVWWDDLWLNEGFASWIEFLATDYLYPEWQMWTQFVGEDYNYALGKNGLANAPALQVDIADPAELDTVFDPAVVYAKGASIIRMMHHYLGEADFQTGLQRYLKKHQYGNTITQDLWAALSEASGKPVGEIMNAWTSQPGYPVLSLSDGQLSQKRFYASPRQAPEQDDSRWPVPVAALTPEGVSADSLLLQTAAAPAPTDWAMAKWLKLNPDQTGLYRTAYSAESLAKLYQPLAEGKLGPIDRYGLIDDALALAQSGNLSTDLVLSLLSQMRSETDYSVWSVMLDIFAAVRGLLDREERQRFGRFGLWLTEEIAQKLTTQPKPDEPHFDRLLRPMVLGFRGRLGDETTVKLARQWWAAGPVEPDFRNFVYATVATWGSLTEYNQMIARYGETSQAQEKQRLLQAIPLYKQPDIIKAAEKFILSDQVRNQDIIFGIHAMTANYEAREAIWPFIRDNWAEWLRRFGGGGHMLDHFPVLIGVIFKTEEQARIAERFFAEHPHPAINRPAKQAVERILLKSDWYKRDKAAISRFIAEQDTK